MMEGPWGTNDVQPQSCDNQQQPTSSGGKLRMPTVHDALPFTPLPSIVPFSPDIIQPPTAAPVVHPTAFSNYDDVNISKAVLDQLSAGATNAETASRRCQQSIRDVQRLLDADSLTPLTFRRPRRSNVATEPSQTSSKKTTAALSSFAKMALDNTATQFHYLTPENSPEPERESNGHALKIVPVPSLTTAQSFVKPTDVLSNGLPPSHSAGPPSSSQLLQVSAVTPKALSGAQRAEYQYMPDQNSIAGAQYLTPSKPPPSSSANRSANLAQREQREQSNQILGKLQNLLADILEKEDQMQLDTSGQVSTDALGVFELHDTHQGSKPVLRASKQATLESGLGKLVSNGWLAEVETHDLQRVQRLCEIPVASTDSLTFSIGDDWAEQDTDEWLQRIRIATHGLSASRTLVLIMTGGAHIQELQTEDHLSKVIDALVAVTERCIIPLAEERPTTGEKTRGDKGSSSSNPKFAIAFNNKQYLQAPLDAAIRTMRSLGELLVIADVEESILSRVETLCKTIIFAENATMERDSALGSQKFETMRQATMDVYARIFTKYTDQRQYILDEILSSLEKLPATKQSARQYRPQDTKPIQLVSALLMRLVQTSATRAADALKLRNEGDQADSSDEESAKADSDEEVVRVTQKKPRGRPGSLLAIVKPLHDAALANAQYIVKTLIEKAVVTSKSSDEPFRRLLDIFTEDFLNVLGSSDWPASEMLLRTLVMHMIGIVENPKYPVPARTLALELLGVIGSGIIELQMNARHAEQSIDVTEEMAGHLKGLLHQTESGNMQKSDLVALDGPYRMWAEYLTEKGANENPLLQSAHGYMLMQWAYTATTTREASADSNNGDALGLSGGLHAKLGEMLLDPKWLDDRGTLRVGTSLGRLAVLVTTLSSKLCKAFQRILNLLLSSMSSEHPTIKSRSLKSINALLEKDPTMLDRYSAILTHISRCLQDASALVRDSALTLLQKCLTLRPKLDGKAYAKIIERTRDNNIGVRKRAMKMVKEVYLRNQETLSMRSAIVDAILWRLEDTEDNVSELARITMEEVWFQPFHGMNLGGDGAVATKLAFHSHAALAIATIDRDDRLLSFLESLTKRFTTSSKAARANTEVCRTMVTVLFDGIIDNSDIPGAPAQSAILRSLTTFAKATPTLFTAAQLERLEPYTQNLTKTDELEVYRYVITILRYVMPHLTMTMKNDFLQKMQTTLLTSVTRFQKQELREVAPCLWTINGMLGNTERLVNFMSSVLRNIYLMRNENLSDSAKAMKVSRLMVIASEFGNACDFDSQLATFKAKGKCDWYRGDSVSGLIVETLCNYTSPKQPVGVRRTAIDGICTVSQAWPKQFLRADVTNALETVFMDRIPEIEVVLLAGLEAFFVAQEIPDDDSNAQELPAGIASGTERLGRTYVASDTEGASTSLAQRFLRDIHRVALSSCTEPAFIAARLVVSVNKQGLVHPNESCPALVALESCPNKSVASAAFKEHKAQHQKHETLYEKEYIHAVQQTFDYQNEVVGSPLGFANLANPSAKMHLLYEVLKGGKAQVRKKFLTKISQRMDFDPAKLEARTVMPAQLAFVRFCCENLALFEYDKVEDLLHLLVSLEKIFSSTGSSVAQTIESDVLKIHVDNMLGSEGMVNGTYDTGMAESSRGEVDPSRLRQLCVSAQILSVIWETRGFLRKVWNMQKYIAKTKGKDKDANKTPNRATNAQGLIDAYLKRIQQIVDSATSEHDQRVMCGAFVELISVDNEVKVNSDNEENIDMDVLAAGYDTPSESSGRKSPLVGASGGGRGRKRKASVSAGGTPRKKGRSPKRSTSFNVAVDGDDHGRWG